MPKICDVPRAGAQVVLLTRDEHCPAHVHAVNKSQQWELRVFFSYADGDPDHLRVEIKAGRPLLGQINDVIDAVDAHLSRCRREWWRAVSTVCLINRTISISSSGILTWSVPPVGVKVQAAQYDPGKNEVKFRARTTDAWQVATCL